MDENEVKTDVAAAEETMETATAKPGKKCSGDLRIFVIALLTSIIVVLAYHGIVSGIRCLKNSCSKDAIPAACAMQHCPPRHKCFREKWQKCDREFRKGFKKDGRSVKQRRMNRRDIPKSCPASEQNVSVQSE